MPERIEPGVAGVRLPDRRQIFVEGAPPDLPEGATVHVLWDGVELVGAVSIAPALIVWRDPEARCGTFVRVESLPPTAELPSAELPLAVLLAEDGAPTQAALAAMLALAREEMDRLDDR